MHQTDSDVGDKRLWSLKWRITIQLWHSIKKFLIWRVNKSNLL